MKYFEKIKPFAEEILNFIRENKNPKLFIYTFVFEDLKAEKRPELPYHLVIKSDIEFNKNDIRLIYKGNYLCSDNLDNDMELVSELMERCIVLKIAYWDYAKDLYCEIYVDGSRQECGSLFELFKVDDYNEN